MSLELNRGGTQLRKIKSRKSLLDREWTVPGFLKFSIYFSAGNLGSVAGNRGDYEQAGYLSPIDRVRRQGASVPVVGVTADVFVSV